MLAKDTKLEPGAPAADADADAFGELGNLYNAMGRRAEALDAYYAAGLRFKAAGAADRLQQVIDILRKEKDDRVADLLR